MAVSCIRQINTDRHHVYITSYWNAGDTCVLHRHARWHLMECRKGRFNVTMWPDGRPEGAITVDLGFLDNIEVPLGWWHRVTALEDDGYTACVFDLYDEEGRLLKDPKADFDPGTQVAA